MHTPLTALCWSSLKYSGVFDDFLMCHLRGTHKTFSKSPQVLIWTVLFLKGSLFNAFRNAMVLREQQWPFEGMEDSFHNWSDPMLRQRFSNWLTSPHARGFLLLFFSRNYNRTMKQNDSLSQLQLSSSLSLTTLRLYYNRKLERKLIRTLFILIKK